MNADRFWSHVRKTGAHECWPWTAALRRGYGLFSVGAHGGRCAHRVSWELTFGPIPSGLSVLHRCDNPICVNPDHLFLGTQADNMLDKMSKGRHRPARGESCGTHKLTEGKVRKVRVMLAQGESQRAIARRFGMHHTTIGSIASGETWGHVS